MLRFGSLFSGIGGFDLGLGRAGLECAWQVEIDRNCTRLLGARWPTVERYADVRTVGTDLAHVDLVCGGFPCQDLSVAGRRAGLAGERSGLWTEFHRVVACLRPSWVLVENVPGLLSSRSGRDFAVLVHGLVKLGYRVAWRILDAQFAGLAQRRDRVFIVGSLGSGGCAEVLFEPSSVRWDPAPRRTPRSSVGPTLNARASGGGGLGTGAELHGGLVAGPVLASAGHHGHSSPRGDGNDLVVPVVTCAVQERDFKGADSNAAGKLVVAPTLRVGGRSQGAGSSSDNTPLVVADPICANEQRAYTHEGNTFRTRNLVSGAVRGNPRNNSNPATEAAEIAARGGVRRLTPRECERLQGFPDDWTAGFSDSVRYRMLGNAVAVPVAAWIGRRLIAAHATCNVKSTPE